jgi:hypothetical protein
MDYRKKIKKQLKDIKKKLSCLKYKIELSKNKFSWWATCFNVFLVLKAFIINIISDTPTLTIMIKPICIKILRWIIGKNKEIIK